MKTRYIAYLQNTLLLAIFILTGCDNGSALPNTDGDFDSRDSSDSSETGDSSEPFCSPGALTCVENNVVTCDVHGTSYQFITNCDDIGFCEDGECKALPVSDGDEESFEDDAIDLDEDNADSDVSEEVSEDKEYEAENEYLGEQDTEFESENIENEVESETEDENEEEIIEEEQGETALCFNDIYSGNDSPENAELLTLPFTSSGLSLCAWEEDWFRFPLELDDGVRITAEFSDTNGDVDIALFQEGAYDLTNYVAASTSNGNTETIVYNVPEAGMYYLNAFMRNGENIYSLQVESNPGGFLIEGNNCTYPFIIETLGSQTPGDTTGFGNDFYASCGVCSGTDAVYSILVAQPTAYQIRVYSDFDAVLSLRSTCNDLSSEIACTDAFFEGQTETINTETLPTGYYNIIVDGYRLGDQGYFVLEITEE